MLKLYVKCRLDVYKRQTDSVFQVGGASSNCLKKRDYQKSLSTGGSLPGSFTTLPLLLGSNLNVTAQQVADSQAQEEVRLGRQVVFRNKMCIRDSQSP